VFVGEPGKEVEDLPAQGLVERRRRFVGDEQLRPPESSLA
jgi:hypothetical protein